MALLLREAIGGEIRRARTERQRTLRDVSRDARVSLGYLSEIERGRKEPSSELLAAICEALAVSLPDLLDDVAASMRPERLRSAPVVPARLRSAVEEALGAGSSVEAPDEETVDEAGAPVEAAGTVSDELSLVELVTVGRAGVVRSAA